MNALLEHHIPHWSKIWAACIVQTHSWRVPPRWKVRDWWDEIDAESIAAARHAMRIFDPDQGRHLAYFVYRQILASARSRYRQEWTYAARYGGSSADGPDIAGLDDRVRIEADEEQIKRALSSLPEADRSLIEQLFPGDSRTDAEVADELGFFAAPGDMRPTRFPIFG